MLVVPDLVVRYGIWAIWCSDIDLAEDVGSNDPWYISGKLVRNAHQVSVQFGGVAGFRGGGWLRSYKHTAHFKFPSSLVVPYVIWTIWCLSEPCVRGAGSFMLVSPAASVRGAGSIMRVSCCQCAVGRMSLTEC